ncbi:Fic family protein [Agromyces luteolus]|uniref:Fic family protein n=1 Tax=Agromyces luteolus TaxID=88373 RepID=A0A7C9LD43_9MICO|nr:Fic family protein [Agromyces luteolus]MUN06671.1 Fic family protein [Agromyces luteolus]GLK27817.1 Fic family protein [Agromyces luteolus]
MANAGTGWPVHGSRTVPWQQSGRHGTRADRMLREITVSLPPMIARLDYRPDPTLTVALADAARAVIAVDTDPRGQLGALGGLLLRTESVSSSRIEQVDASMDDYARAVAGIRSNESASSMVAATRALGRMIERAGTSRRIELDDVLDAHRTLMADDPVDARYAGRVRDVQNWISGSDHSPIGAVHVPPPPELVPELLEDLLAFAARDDLDPVAQAAIAHAQFESIHPFTDGNGRIGRALINAVFRRRGLTSRTVVPVASAMLAERDRYFSLVNGYRDGRVDAFVADLARGTRIAAIESRRAADRLAELPGYWRELTRPRAGSAAAKLLDALAEHPILGAEEAQSLTGAPLSSVYTALDRLEADGVIRQVTARQRNRVWGVVDLLAELDDLAARIAAAVRAAE